MAYCAAMGLDGVSVVADRGASAKSLERPALRLLLERVRAGSVATVVVLKLDRLTRSIRDLADLLDLFAKHDVSLVSVSEHLDTASAAGRLVLNHGHSLTVGAGSDRGTNGDGSRSQAPAWLCVRLDTLRLPPRRSYIRTGETTTPSKSRETRSRLTSSSESRRGRHAWYFRELDVKRH